MKRVIYYIPLTDLQADPNQPRKYMDPQALEYLPASIGPRSHPPQLLAGATEIKLGSIHPTRDFNYVKDTMNGFIAIA